MVHSSIFSFFNNAGHLTLAKDNLIQEVAKTEERRATGEEPEATAEPVSKSPCFEGWSSLASAFEEILQERQSQAQSVSTTSAEVQLQTYFSQQTTPKRSNPLQYWKDHAAQFPSLAAVATKYLCAPCSSVDSERLFSAVANVLEEKRNRLSSDHVEMLIFIKKNIHTILWM